ncbi:MAG: type II toxin-antitoxin system VapC family toxin [Nanoarchaeota archaeon]
MIGLDTSTIIDMVKGVTSIKEILEKQGPIVVNRMSYIELMFGINPDKPAHKKEEEIYDALFEEIPCYELNKEAVKKASLLFHELKKKGKTIGEADCLIAALYLTNGITTILTKNVKHFEYILGMNVVSYN